MSSLVRTLTSIGLLGLLAAASTEAHEVPNDVHVRLLLKADAGELRVLARVPLEAMRDVDFPTFGPEYLDIQGSAATLRDAAMLWLANDLNVIADGVPLPESRLAAVRVSLPSDRSFERFDSALRHLRSPPLPNDTQLVWRQALLDAEFVYDAPARSAELAIEPTLSRLSLQTRTTLTFVLPDGSERQLHYLGDPGRVPFDPTWWQAAGSFLNLGVLHVWSGADHLLFVLCLLIPFLTFKPLIAIITSFTLAHSITLISAALGFVPTAAWFAPLIEVLIAASILFMAFENMVGARLERRLPITFGFGLIHGFAFAYALTSTLQFAGSHVAASLFAFNLGIELGQIAVLLVAVPVLRLVLRHLPPRPTTLVLSAIIAHSAWHWLTERYADWSLFDVAPVSWSAATLAAGMRWAAVVLTAAAVYWGLRRLLEPWIKPADR